jgi:hypothetical protein
MKSLTPGRRCHVTILLHRIVCREAQALAKGCANVGVGAVIEQQLCKCTVLLPATAIGLRHYTSEECGMSAEAVRVDLGLPIHVRAALDQPACDLDFIEIYANMQERCSPRAACRAVQANGRCYSRVREDIFPRVRTCD